MKPGNLYKSCYLPHHYQPTPDRDPSFSVFHVGLMKREFNKMAMLLGAVCWCRQKLYIPKKCTLFQILHQTRSQNIIQFHYNNIWKHMCIKKLSYSTETYLWYNAQRKTGKKYIWFLYHKLVLFLQISNCFCYVPDNYIKGEILGCKPSSVLAQMTCISKVGYSIIFITYIWHYMLVFHQNFNNFISMTSIIFVRHFY